MEWEGYPEEDMNKLIGLIKEKKNVHIECIMQDFGWKRDKVALLLEVLRKQNLIHEKWKVVGIQNYGVDIATHICEITWRQE